MSALDRYRALLVLSCTRHIWYLDGRGMWRCDHCPEMRKKINV